MASRADAGDAPAPERIQKVLARAGVGSRRVCDELVAAGRVRVNGAVAEPGQRVDPGADLVVVDGVPVPVAPDLVHYLVNKPPGVVSTASDPEGRRTVVDLVPRAPRVFPVGRLDYDTEGLIVLTNDGALAQRLTHPSHGVAKEYLVEVAADPPAAALRALREGVELEDGRTAPARVGRVGHGLLSVVIHEGRNRQVRRMFDAVGHPVRRLVRTRIGPVTDPGLRPGTWRTLTRDEVRALYAAATDAARRGRGGAARAPGGRPEKGAPAATRGAGPARDAQGRAPQERRGPRDPGG
jgi:23S rRNA pseudouridine2605 synthase